MVMDQRSAIEKAAGVDSFEVFEPGRTAHSSDQYTTHMTAINHTSQHTLSLPIAFPPLIPRLFARNVMVVRCLA